MVGEPADHEGRYTDAHERIAGDEPGGEQRERLAASPLPFIRFRDRGPARTSMEKPGGEAAEDQRRGGRDRQIETDRKRQARDPERLGGEGEPRAERE